MSATTLTLWIPGVPIAQPRQKQAKHGKNYTPAKHPVNTFKASLSLAVANQWQGGLWEGPIKLTIVAWFPRPKSKQWKTKAQTAYWHTGRPDGDNILKAVQDALTHVLWVDDAQVSEVTISKAVCGARQTPGVQVLCRLLDSDNLGALGIHKEEYDATNRA